MIACKEYAATDEFQLRDSIHSCLETSLSVFFALMGLSAARRRVPHRVKLGFLILVLVLGARSAAFRLTSPSDAASSSESPSCVSSLPTRWSSCTHRAPPIVASENLPTPGLLNPHTLAEKTLHSPLDGRSQSAHTSIPALASLMGLRFFGLLPLFLFAAELVWAHRDLAAQPRPDVVLGASPMAKYRLVRQYRRGTVQGPRETWTLTTVARDGDDFRADAASTCISASTDREPSERADSDPGWSAWMATGEPVVPACTGSPALVRRVLSSAPPLSHPPLTLSSAEPDPVPFPSYTLPSPLPAESSLHDVRSAVSSTSSTSSGSSAGAEVKPHLTAMPGRKLQVFPIGLIVFASLNSLALLVSPVCPVSHGLCHTLSSNLLRRGRASARTNKPSALTTRATCWIDRLRPTCTGNVVATHASSLNGRDKRSGICARARRAATRWRSM